MLKIFRATAILEGISYLALFGITMPLKYWAEIPGPIRLWATPMVFCLFSTSYWPYFSGFRKNGRLN